MKNIIITCTLLILFTMSGLANLKNDSTIKGLLHLDGEPVSVKITDGKIVEIKRLSPDDNMPRMYIAPGLIDIQINGYMGIDFASQYLNIEGIREATKALWKQGVTSFLPTLITADQQSLKNSFSILSKAKDDEVVGMSIPGFHLEGPYISPVKGYRGAHLEKYSIETEQGKPILKIFVEDTGIGIPKDKQEFIFDIFRQVDDSDSRTYGGTGIGLSIAKKLAELLSGKIWIESEQGRGSAFYFTIPFDEHKEISKPIIKEVEKENSFKEKTILVVEDDKLSFKLIEIVLQKSGVNIIWEDGKESIKLCKGNANIDLVLMDINMPEMNGYEAAIEIKKFRPELPIIVQTANAIAGDREKSLEAGCDDYISKPIKKEMLLAKIERLIESG